MSNVRRQLNGAVVTAGDESRKDRQCHEDAESKIARACDTGRGGAHAHHINGRIGNLNA
jgi:hypothetical protein